MPKVGHQSGCKKYTAIESSTTKALRAGDSQPKEQIPRTPLRGNAYEENTKNTQENTT